MSSEATTRGERTTCERCGLPHYVDHGGCPYCERASTPERAETNAGADSNADTPSTADIESRPRETCGDCGLPYYADENDRCPYCERATPESDATAVEATSDRTDAADRAGAERSEAERNDAGRGDTERSDSDRPESFLERFSKKVRGVLQTR